MKEFKPINFDAPYVMNIDNQLVADAPTTFEVYNPATGAVLANVPRATKDHLDKAVTAASTAFKSWSKLSWDERAEYLVRFADALDVHQEDLKTLLTLEQGKPRYTQADFSVNFSHKWIRDYSTRRLLPEVVEDSPEKRVEVRHVPIGVVGLITPWNFPYLLAVWQIAPILLSGCTCILKPTSSTPLTSLRLGEVAAQILPPGVLNVLSGCSDFGQAMAEHPGIAQIGFTGSTETGKKLIESSASTVKRLTLELGGNDPAIVLPDADLDKVLSPIIWGAIGNSGQWCIGVKRIYVHSSLHAEFVKRAVELCKNLKVGDGMDPASDLGPIQNRGQFNKLIDLLDDIKKNGYKIALGGEVDPKQPGNFFPVTIIDNPPENSRIVQEEQFGLIVPIVSYDDVDDVIEHCNNSRYGLGASVWGSDRNRAIAIGDQLEAGGVWVNCLQLHGVDIPFCGIKESGLGVENGLEGLRDYCNSITYFYKK